MRQFSARSDKFNGHIYARFRICCSDHQIQRLFVKIPSIQVISCIKDFCFDHTVFAVVNFTSVRPYHEHKIVSFRQRSHTAIKNIAFRIIFEDNIQVSVCTVYLRSFDIQINGRIGGNNLVGYHSPALSIPQSHTPFIKRKTYGIHTAFPIRNVRCKVGALALFRCFICRQSIPDCI